MELLLISLLVLALIAAGAAAFGVGRQKLVRDVARDHIRLRFEQVAAEVPGLQVVSTDDGRPRLTGIVDGVQIEIDYENYIAFGLEALLGMRCAIPEAEGAPNAALYIGEVMALHTQFGRPRPLADGHGLFDVYTRTEPSASDWWQERDLHDELASIPGAGVLLRDGRLTVIFSDLDAESVRSVLRIPALIRQGVSRVTIH